MGPRPWAPTPPHFFYGANASPLEHRTCPEGSIRPHACPHDLSKSMSFHEGYLSRYLNGGPKYEYCLKRDLDKFCSKAKTLPRNLGSSADGFKGPKVHPQRSVCFYGVDNVNSPCRHRAGNTFVVRADVETPR